MLEDFNSDDGQLPKAWKMFERLENGKYRSTRSGAVPPCAYVDGVSGYLNLNNVKQALHVDTNIEWNICSNLDYGYAPNGSIPQYHQLLNANKYQILIYNGDSDSVVPFNDNEYWIGTYGLDIVEKWRPWYNGNQVSGMVQVYDGLTFATVKGAGHMVPQVKREAAFTMAKSFITGQPLPNNS